MEGRLRGSDERGEHGRRRRSDGLLPRREERELPPVLDGLLRRLHLPGPVLLAEAVDAHEEARPVPVDLDGGIARFGKSYTGEPDRIAAELAEDAAVAMADTVLMTVPNQLGVDYNAELLRNIAEHVAPAIGWAPATAAGTTPAGPG